MPGKPLPDGRGRKSPKLAAPAEGPASGRRTEAGAETGRASGFKSGTGRLRAGTERVSGTALAALQAARGCIAAVVGLAARARGAVGFPFIGWDGPVAVPPHQIAQQRVLPVEHPEVAAAAVVPVAILVALPDRRHVSEAGRLGHLVHFGVVLAHRLVGDGHADVVFANLVSGARNLNPGLIGIGDAALAGGIRKLRFDGADLFFVIARTAGLAVPQIHQDL